MPKYSKENQTNHKYRTIRIFELQSRTLSSLITVFLLGPLIALISPIFFWRSPLQLFFTYLVPLIPICVVFDGYISSLRTRTPDEVAALLRRASAKIGRDGANGNRTGTGVGGKDDMIPGWRFVSGSEMHTNPTGWMSWIICVKE
jgi:hypothetical protein